MGLFSFLTDKEDIDKINSSLHTISTCLSSLRDVKNLSCDDFNNMQSRIRDKYEDLTIIILIEVKNIYRIVKVGSKSLSTRLFCFDGKKNPIKRINQNVFDEVMSFRYKFDLTLEYQEEFEVMMEYGINQQN